MYHASHELGRVPIDALVAWAGGACSVPTGVRARALSLRLHWNLYAILQISNVIVVIHLDSLCTTVNFWGVLRFHVMRVFAARAAISPPESSWQVANASKPFQKQWLARMCVWSSFF
jgi:hypothetical protein